MRWTGQLPSASSTTETGRLDFCALPTTSLAYLPYPISRDNKRTAILPFSIYG